MATGLDIVTAALQEVGVLAGAETAKANMSNDALGTLNRMVSNWSNQGRIVYEIYDETQTITANTGTYTIGDGATWDTDRPIKIEAFNVRDSNNYNTPLKIYTLQEWREITDKTLTSSYPSGIYYDKTYPNGIINFYPIPNQSLTAVIYSWKQFSAFTLAGTVSLPPGYEEVLVLHLAMKLCRPYGKSVPTDLRADAWQALQLIKSVNDKPGQTKVDPALLRRGRTYNVYTDQ